MRTIELQCYGIYLWVARFIGKHSNVNRSPMLFLKLYKIPEYIFISKNRVSTYCIKYVEISSDKCKHPRCDQSRIDGSYSLRLLLDTIELFWVWMKYYLTKNLPPLNANVVRICCWTVQICRNADYFLFQQTVRSLELFDLATIVLMHFIYWTVYLTNYVFRLGFFVRFLFGFFCMFSVWFFCLFFCLKEFTRWKKISFVEEKKIHSVAAQKLMVKLTISFKTVIHSNDCMYLVSH